MTKLLDKLNIDKSEFFLQFQSHPNYPFSLAFTETLSFMGVNNQAYTLDKEYWADITESFITIYKNKFTLVEKRNDLFILYSDVVSQATKEDLYEYSESVVISYEDVSDKEKKSGIVGYIFILQILSIFIITSAISFSWEILLFNTLSALGLFTSLEIFKNKNDNSIILNKICNNESDQTNNCSKIINSSHLKFLNFKLSDWAIFYFSLLTFLGLFFSISHSIIFLFSFLSFPIVIYSLYIQFIIEKTLCKVCVFIIILLVIQLLISTFFFSWSFSLNAALISLIGVITLYRSISYVNKLTEEKNMYKKSNLKNLRLKRDYDIFKRELLNDEKFDFEFLNLFHLGKNDAKLHITIISNPYCSFCVDAHKLVVKLLADYGDYISIQIRFNEDIANSKIAMSLEYIYNNYSEEKFLEALSFWFNNKNEEKLMVKYNVKLEDSTSGNLIKIGKENQNFNLSFTPIFILNGYLYPNKYDIDDLFYFIEDILEDDIK